MAIDSPIPVHLVLGSLGAGKTTAIIELLKTAPTDEKWAVFINEFGRVPIDPGLLDGPDRKLGRLVIIESAGGCICCSAGPDLKKGITELVEQHQPDRILIEPTGLSDPLALKNQIQTHASDWGIQLVSTVGVIDIRLFQKSNIDEIPFWRTLIDCCDDVLGSKGDLAKDEALANFNKAMNNWIPSKRRVFNQLVDLASSNWLSPNQKNTISVHFLHEEPAPHGMQNAHVAIENLAERSATRFSQWAEAHTAHGWIFPEDTSFDLEALKLFLSVFLKNCPNAIRLKGFLNTTSGWCVCQFTKGDPLDIIASSSHHDNRLEVIFEGKVSQVKLFEENLINCIVKTALLPNPWMLAKDNS